MEELGERVRWGVADGGERAGDRGKVDAGRQAYTHVSRSAKESALRHRVREGAGAGARRLNRPGKYK